MNTRKSTNSATAGTYPVWHINIRHITGNDKTIRLSVTDDDRVRDLKIAIEELPELSAHAIHLICRGTLLENERRLVYYGVGKDSHVYAVVRIHLPPLLGTPHEFHLDFCTECDIYRSEMTPIYEIVDEALESPFTLLVSDMEVKVSATSTIQYVCSRIQDETSIPISEQILLDEEDIVLHPNGLLVSYGIDWRSNLELCTSYVPATPDPSPNDHTQVFVRAATGRTVNITLPVMCTVGYLKSRLKDRGEKVPLKWMRLEFSGKELANDRSLHSLRITAGITLHLSIRQGGHPVVINGKMS